MEFGSFKTLEEVLRTFQVQIQEVGLAYRDRLKERIGLIS